jgi:hypothetical protein
VVPTKKCKVELTLALYQSSSHVNVIVVPEANVAPFGEIARILSWFVGERCPAPELPQSGRAPAEPVATSINDAARHEAHLFAEPMIPLRSRRLGW